MYHSTQHFPGHDRLSLFEQSWGPEGSPRAAVVLIHGLMEHSGRHENTALELVRQGYAVHAMDLRGHGRSAGRRCDVRSFDEYLLDLDVFFARVRAREGDRPLFLMGNSMGGLIVATWTMLRGPQLNGLILSGPLLELGDDLYPRLRHLTAAAGAVLPWFRVPRIPFHWLSRSPEVVERFRKDPLVCHSGFTARLAAGLLAAMNRLSARASALNLPLLILHGGDDRICSAAGSRALYSRAASSDKSLQVYDGLFHEVFDEPERQRVWADLIAWLDRRAPRSQAAACPIQLAR
jgi:acylglycerol lipase